MPCTSAQACPTGRLGSASALGWMQPPKAGLTNVDDAVGGMATGTAQFVYVKVTGEESEPMGANQLAALIVLGQISRDSLVRQASGSLRFAQFTKIKAVRSAVAALEAEDGADARGLAQIRSEDFAEEASRFTRVRDVESRGGEFRHFAVASPGA